MSRFFILIFVFGCFFSMPNLKAQDPHWEYVDNLPLTFNTSLVKNRIYGYEDTLDSVVYLYGDLSDPGDTSFYLTNTIIRYDGSDYEYLGIFLGNVYEVIKFQDQIYAGGSFWRVDGNTSLKYLIKYTENSWSSDWQINDAVKAMATDGNYLYIAGDFTTINGESFQHLARYDGNTWEALPPAGFLENGAIRTMCIYQNELYIGGNFHEPGVNASAMRVLRDGQWVPIEPSDGSIFGSIRDMEVHQDKLYLTGGFSDSSIHPSLIVWDGNTISAPYPNFYADNFLLGEGIIPQRLVSTSHHLYACGGFEYIGDIHVNQIAAYNGEHWCGMFTDGNLRFLYAMFSLRDTVYAYLYFNPYSATLYPSGLYKWVGGDDYENCESTGVLENENAEFQVYPNPVRNYCVVQGDFKGNMRYSLYDISGRLILQNQTAVRNSFQLDLRTVPAGSYVLKLQNGRHVLTTKIQKL